MPSFGSRKVKTRLRLREGESNLLAGLLRDDQRKSLTGFPGVIHVPVLRSLFGSTSDTINQTDIVMLLTPHIVRTHELTAEDLAPIYIGTQAERRLDRSAAADRACAERRTSSSRSAAFWRSDQSDSRNAAARTCAASGGGARQACRSPTRAAARNVARAELPAAPASAGGQSGGSGAGRTARGHAAAGDRRAADHGGAVTGRSQCAGGAADGPAARRDADSAERAGPVRRSRRRHK